LPNDLPTDRAIYRVEALKNSFTGEVEPGQTTPASKTRHVVVNPLYIHGSVMG